MEENFKVICKEPKSSHIIRVKLTKAKFFSHLNKGLATIQNMYPGGKSFIAERLQNSMDLLLPLPFGEYADQVDNLVNKDPQRLMRHAFDVFDFNQDGFIDEVDIYCMIKLCDFSHPSVARKLKDKRATLPVSANMPQTEADRAIKQKETVTEVTPSQSRFERLI